MMITMHHLTDGAQNKLDALGEKCLLADSLRIEVETGVRNANVSLHIFCERFALSPQANSMSLTRLHKSSCAYGADTMPCP